MLQQLSTGWNWVAQAWTPHTTVLAHAGAKPMACWWILNLETFWQVFWQDWQIPHFRHKEGPRYTSHRITQCLIQQGEMHLNFKCTARETQLLMITSPIHGVVSEAGGICPWPPALTTDWTGRRDNNSYQHRTPTPPPAQQNVEVNYNILTWLGVVSCVLILTMTLVELEIRVKYICKKKKNKTKKL